MSSTAQPLPFRSDRPDDRPADLQALRAELDRLDDQVHDLLMRRAEVVAQVGALKANGPVPIRPGREASIIRRLLARHAGPLPPSGIARIWRAVLNAFTAQQRAMLISVCEAEDGLGYVAVALEHFGALTALRPHRTPAQAVGEVSAGVATAAVLPVPTATEAAGWWTALLLGDDPRLHVVARLPFWAARPEGAPAIQAFVVCATAPDPSGDDRSLIGLEVPPDISRAQLAAAVAAAGFRDATAILRRDPGASAAYALVDVDGFVADADPRLAAMALPLRPPVVLGAYAVPVGAPAP